MAHSISPFLDTCRGSIHVIKGPMRSGKTQELLRLAGVFESAGRVVRYVKAQGIENAEKVTSRSGGFRDSVPVKKLLEDVTSLDFDVLAIDEGWAIEDLVEGCLRMAFEHQKYVIVATLDAYYDASPIDQVARLCVFAQQEEKLLAICMQCQRAPASLSRKIDAENAQHCDPGSAKYDSLCPSCYLEPKKEEKSALLTEDLRAMDKKERDKRSAVVFDGDMVATRYSMKGWDKDEQTRVPTQETLDITRKLCDILFQQYGKPSPHLSDDSEGNATLSWPEHEVYASISELSMFGSGAKLESFYFDFEKGIIVFI